MPVCTPNPRASLLVGLALLAAPIVAAATTWATLLSGTERVAAFYYVWYGDVATDGRFRHWNHEVLPHWRERERGTYAHGARFNPPGSLHSPFYPLRGPYSSSSRDVIRQHIAEMAASNIGVLVVSWWGPAWREGTHDTQGVNTDAVLGLVVSELEQQQQVKLAFHMEPYQGRTVSTVREDLQHLASKYGSSAALLRLGGRPVFFVYDHYHIPADAWASLLRPGGGASVRGTQLDGVFIALTLSQSDGADIAAGGFDGLYTYFASDSTSWASQPAHWPQIARWADEHGLLFVASVGPGYNDTKIRPWNAAATREREDGARYKRYWRDAAASGAQAVAITSYNEWGEGTQIEPAQPWADAATGEACPDYGPDPHLYMHITRRQAAHFMQLWRDRLAVRGGGGAGGVARAVARAGGGVGGGQEAAVEAAAAAERDSAREL